MDTPGVAADIRYVRNGSVAIAYQVVGSGATDLVFVPDYTSNLVHGWEHPYWRGFYERLAASFRLILFDKRGTGLSDHGGQFPSLETRMDDLRAVLEAAGSSTAVVLGGYDGCSMAALYAATFPERVRALVLFQPRAHGEPNEETAWLNDMRDRWGTIDFHEEQLASICPSLAETEAGREWFVDDRRLGASPAVAYELNLAWIQTDLREILAAVRVPTLVLHRGKRGQKDAQDVVRRIVASRVTGLAGDDWWGIFLSPEIVEEVERFVGGQEPPQVPDSVLATLLFTDIVGSTTRAAELGDHGWREVLGRHHDLVRRELARFRGEEQDTAGDGFFATFDGPARAIRCAQAIAERVRELGLEIRAGLHTGECELHDGKVAGLAVAIGARVAARASAGEVLVTGTVKDLVAGSGLSFEPRGDHELKGVPGTWQVFAVTAPDS